MKQIKVQIPIEQKVGKDYLVVRTQLVRVRRTQLVGGCLSIVRDKELSFSTVIPNTTEEALDLFKKIAENNLKYGKAMSLERRIIP